MAREMKKINGIPLTTFPFMNLKRIGDLVFYDGALMTLFKNDKDYVIYDWVEANEKFNRWLIYSVSKELIINYINKKISHFQIINDPEIGLMFITDIDSDIKFHNTQVISLNKIPFEYIPKTDIYFDESESPDVDIIKNFFDIEAATNFILPLEQTFDIFEESEKNKVELYNIHLKSSNGKVGYGKVHASVFGKILSNFYDLSFNISSDYFSEIATKAKGGKFKRKKGQLNQIKEYAEIEYLYSKAASFSIFLKPVKNLQDVFAKSPTELIASNIFELLEKGQNLEIFDEITSSFSSEVLNSFKNLLTEIKNDGIDIFFQYGNFRKNITYKSNYTPKIANDVISKLDSLKLEKPYDLQITGNFKALDSIAKTFKIEATDNEVYSGKFSEQIKDSIFLLDLKNQYESVITVTKQKKPTNNDLHDKNVMVSCILKV